MIVSIYIFEIISAVCFAKPEGLIIDLTIFVWIAEFLVDASVANPSGIKTFLANGLSTIFNKIKPIFSNGPIPRNSSNNTILDN